MGVSRRKPAGSACPHSIVMGAFRSNFFWPFLYSFRGIGAEAKKRFPLQSLTLKNQPALPTMNSKKLPPDFEYLKDMYDDAYFPNFLVDKLSDIIKETVRYIEEGNHSIDEIQESFDQMTLKTNALEDEFEENGSEMETGARESIGQTIQNILTYFDIDIHIEDAIRLREW